MTTTCGGGGLAANTGGDGAHTGQVVDDVVGGGGAHTGHTVAGGGGDDAESEGHECAVTTLLPKPMPKPTNSAATTSRLVPIHR